MLKVELVNLSKVIRDIDLAGKAILKDIGDSVAEGIWEEFLILLEETAQWSGTTTASWNLQVRGRGLKSDSHMIIMPPRTKADALRKGDSAAIAVAVAQNQGVLDNLSTDYVRKDIFISNAAPGAYTAEYGKVRECNTPGGALARFEERLQTKLFAPIRSRII